MAPWGRVLLEKLIVAELVNKFPAFYATRKFVTVFTRARQFRGSVQHFVTTVCFTVWNCLPLA